MLDISFDVPDCDAVLTDRIEDTIDYAEVADIVALAVTERSYRTLERLGNVVAERLMERYGSDAVRVRAAKPEPPIPLAVEEVAVEVVRAREPDEPIRTTTRSRADAGRLPGPGLQCRRPRRPPAGGRRAARRTWRRDRGGLFDLRDRARRRGPRPARLPQRGRARSRRPSSPRSCSTSARPWRPSGGGSSAVRRHGPRPLDVDLLLLGDVELETQRLTLPHREVTRRRFVLEPLLELEPELRLPDGTQLSEALTRLGRGSG